jgi:hypothetical protein
VPAPVDGFVVCPVEVKPDVAKICPGLYTTVSPFYACVDCSPAGGCLANPEKVYCVGAGGCAMDPLCGLNGAKKR